MADERVLVNAGGQIFETTASTLRLSGAGYFDRLLGDTGDAMPGKKRARTDDADADAAPREVFVDRDPELFRVVLAFMRSNRLPAAAARDRDRLTDLKCEAEFLCYDRLTAACDEALEALVVPPAPEARCRCLYVPAAGDGNWGEAIRVDVAEGEVAYVTRVVPSLATESANETVEWTLRLRNGQTQHLGDGVEGVIDLSTYSIGATKVSKIDKGYIYDDVNFVAKPVTGRDHIVLDAFGTGWSVTVWVGRPEAIPGLGLVGRSK